MTVPSSGIESGEPSAKDVNINRLELVVVT